MTKEYRVRIIEEDFRKVRSILMADMPKEAAAFLIVGLRASYKYDDLIVRRVVEIPNSEYHIQKDDHLEISSKAINGLISLCEANNLGVILCHSHPTDVPYSKTDYYGEERIANTLWQFMPEKPVGSLLFTPNNIYGRIWNRDEGLNGISIITVIGRNIRKIWLKDNGFPNFDKIETEIYDRQILAFGQEGQKKISETKVGIVGYGGTGSPSTEQLVRLGVKDLVLIEKDLFERSNKTRIYGSYHNNGMSRWYNPLSWFIKEAKVVLAYKHLKKINPEINIKVIKGNVNNTEVCNALLDRDVIFSCTDDHWGRSIINQVAYQYLIPVINMGVRIDADGGKIKGAASSVHILRPGKPCLWCYDFLKASRIYAESLPLEQRKSLLREGYVDDIDSSAPSVIPLTTTISGHAITLFLQIVTDFMGKAGDISCLIHYIMEGEVSRGRRKIEQGCVCQAVKGYGDLKPLHTIQ